MKAIIILGIVSLSLALTGCESAPTGPTSTQPPPPKSPGLPFGDVRVLRPAQLDQQPVIAFMPSPFELRAEFEKKKLIGEATIGFSVSKDGKPEKITVVQSSDPELARLAAAYVVKLRFKPARAAGAPTVCEMEMPFFQK